MDAIKSAHRIEYPINANLTSIPLEILEMICHFLSAEDIAHLSIASKSTNDNLSQRIHATGIAGIRKALSEGRTAEAFPMLGNFCKWLGSVQVQLPLNDTLQTWKVAQEFAGHACFSETEQSQALRQVYFWACRSSNSSADEMLALVQEIRAIWFSRCFPNGSVFIKGNPCKSFSFIAQYLNDGRYQQGQETGDGSYPKPPKSVAWLGASIEAIRLHENPEDNSRQFATVASKIREGYAGIPQQFRVTLVLDLIECIKQFTPEDALLLLPQIDPLIDAAEAEEKSVYQLAVQGVNVRLHRQVAPEPDDCRLM
jgi:hypothetical protein